MTYMGIESKEWIYVYTYITDVLFCIAETNTILYINYTPIKINFKNLKHKKTTGISWWHLGIGGKNLHT